MRRADVVLNNDLPLPPTEPAPHETLHLRRYKEGSLDTVIHTCCTYRACDMLAHNSKILIYLFDLFYIRVFIFMVDMVRPHSLLSFVQSYNL